MSSEKELQRRAFALCERSGLTFNQTTAISLLIFAMGPELNETDEIKVSEGLKMLDDRMTSMGMK